MSQLTWLRDFIPSCPPPPAQEQFRPLPQTPDGGKRLHSGPGASPLTDCLRCSIQTYLSDRCPGHRSLKCGLHGLVLSETPLPCCPTDRAVEAQSFLPLFRGPLPSPALPSSTLSFTTPETGQGPSYYSSVSDPAGCQTQLESHPVLVLLS